MVIAGGGAESGGNQEMFVKGHKNSVIRDE